MMSRSLLFLSLLALLATAALAAGPGTAAADAPGAIPLQDLGLFPRDRLSVEINLAGPLLAMVAAATRQEDPEFAAVMANLKAIHVQVFPLKGITGIEPLRERIDRATRWLEDRGWTSTVRVREKGEETCIYVKESGGQIVGLTVLSLQPGDEAALINIVGRLDPAQLGRLGSRLDIPQLKNVQAQRPGDRP